MKSQKIKDELQSTRFKQKKLIARKIDDELLLFDEETSTAHCLNGIAGEMWMACERENSAAKVADVLRTRWPDLEEEVVRASLSRMAAAGLFEERIGAEKISTARRELIRKLGFTAALVLPIVVTSVLIPPAASAASCGHLLSPCGGSHPPCCSGFHCLVGVCEPIG
jgi:hypothetical protein